MVRAKLAAKAFPALILILLASCRDPKPLHPPHNSTSVYDLFNQEAQASDPGGLHLYAEDLIGLVVSPGVDDETRQHVIDALAGRLRRAEEAARAGHGKLIPEANVVRAYNEMMSGIGAPSSLRATERPVRQFREYAESFKAFPALFTAGHNGTNCNPGEAVYLLHLLLSNDGKPSEEDLYSAWVKKQPGDQSRTPPRPNDQGNRGQEGYDPGRPQWLIYRYSLDHKRDATVALFQNAADLLGF